MWATSCQNSGRKPQDGRGGEQRPLETLLSCLSARWYDGRLCGEEGGAWVCFVFFFFSSLSYHSKVHNHLFQWAELSRRSILWMEERGKGRYWSIGSCSTSHHQTEQISEYSLTTTNQKNCHTWIIIEKKLSATHRILFQPQ